MTTLEKSIWTLPDQEPDIREQELLIWRDTIKQVISIAAGPNYSRTDVAKMADVPVGTFSSWFAGKYGKTTHNITQKVLVWVNTHYENVQLDAKIIEGPEFISTPSSTKLFDALMYAQQAPSMIVATMGAGMGKTTTCNHFIKVRPHAYIGTMRPQTRSVHGLMIELARILGVTQNNPAKLDTAIGEKLKRNGRNTLLILDEAQNLEDMAVDQLRYFLDAYKCGIALIGNEETYKRFAGVNRSAQLSRRIGMRLKQLQPTREDITAILNGWKIEDNDCRALLSAIGNKEGALGQMTETIKLASMLAAGKNETMGAKHIKAAWTNRSPEVA